jgi:hypothetical protein
MRLSHANPGTEYVPSQEVKLIPLSSRREEWKFSDNVRTRNGRPRDDHDHDDYDDYTMMMMLIIIKMTVY